ncbi:AMP-binding protein (plasmid) [Streptomyces sp. NBC_01717]|uniref:AMP-binding protein n=1 Tax=Streptomyces sp. NBC_01717 TaxID=2975918 RepID=UPI002E2F3E02|nr:AMP-binding protein [Streptomyces sp. NBC_01717]
MPLLERICRHTLTTPDAPAMILNDDVLSYLELDRRSDAIAEHLAQRGAGPETVVGLCDQPHPDWLAALLGILKAGAALLPLYTTYPAGRVQTMLADASVETVCVTGPPARNLADFTGRLLDCTQPLPPEHIRAS